MYTVIWTENGQLTVARVESRRLVAATLIEHGVQDDPSVLIFTPQAEYECTIAVADVFQSL